MHLNLWIKPWWSNQTKIKLEINLKNQSKKQRIVRKGSWKANVHSPVNDDLLTVLFVYSFIASSSAHIEKEIAWNQAGLNSLFCEHSSVCPLNHWLWWAALHPSFFGGPLLHNRFALKSRQSLFLKSFKEIERENRRENRRKNIASTGPPEISLEIQSFTKTFSEREKKKRCFYRTIKANVDISRS